MAASDMAQLNAFCALSILSFKSGLLSPGSSAAPSDLQFLHGPSNHDCCFVAQWQQEWSPRSCKSWQPGSFSPKTSPTATTYNSLA